MAQKSFCMVLFLFVNLESAYCGVKMGTSHAYIAINRSISITKSNKKITLLMVLLYTKRSNCLYHFELSTISCDE